MNKLSLFGLLLALLVIAGCKGDQNSNSGTDSAPAASPPAKTLAVPAFNRDSAFSFVEQQLAFGPRVPGTEAHKACKEWLAAKLREYGATVIEQNFTASIYNGQKWPATNIIGQYNPGAGRRILLAAHWDSRFIADSPLSTVNKDKPVPGADDGASGVAVLLEVARQLHESPVEVGVDIVFFDAEDQGKNGGGANTENTWGLGAQHWARSPHTGGTKPQFGILLDMVGAKDAQFRREYHSMAYAGDLVDKVWKLAANMGYGNYFLPENGGGVTDDHYFVNTIAGIPMIDIINQPNTAQNQPSFGEHWHTQGDNISVIDPRTLRAVGQVMLAVVYREHNGTF